MGAPIKNITIVGGGTSGWLTAAFLSRAMEASLTSGDVTITLIESPRIPIIGVGEATSPALPSMLQYIGVDESQFITKANAAFKLSGYFDGWNVGADGTPVAWTNPFLASGAIAGLSPAYHYTAFRGDTGTPDFSSVISSSPSLIAANKGPRPQGAPDYQYTVPYAYHFDAIEVAKILRDVAKARGVNHILDDVSAVNLDQRGFVSSLSLQENGEHPIELVIDSSGFAGVVINKTLKEPFDPFSKYLPNDRAAVVQIPHENPDYIEPVSRAIGMNSGWRFIVPLYNRVGTGYIFSSQFMSDDDAIAELKTHLGDHAKDKEPRIIPMRIGKSRRSWVNNCIAIGLSSGFVEPLEATAIHAVDLSVRWLYSHFPDSDFAPPLQSSYNKLVDEFYVEAIDFIALHFHLNNRTDSAFWRAAREETPIPDSLAAKLDLWRHKMPSPSDLETAHFFNATNYVAALIGKGFYDGGAPALPGVTRTDWEAHCRARTAQNEKLLAALAGHKALLDSIRGVQQAGQPMMFGGPTLGGGGGAPMNISYAPPTGSRS